MDVNDNGEVTIEQFQTFLAKPTTTQYQTNTNIQNQNDNPTNTNVQNQNPTNTNVQNQNQNQTTGQDPFQTQIEKTTPKVQNNP